MSTATLRTLIEDVEAQLVKAPDLGIKRGDALSGPSTMPNQRGKAGFYVRRELSRNLDQTRNQDNSRIEDIVVVEVQQRIQPKAQRTSRGALYDIEESIINRVTELAHERRWNPTYIDTLEELQPGEWLKVFIRFSFKRFGAVGGG